MPPHEIHLELAKACRFHSSADRRHPIGHNYRPFGTTNDVPVRLNLHSHQPSRMPNLKSLGRSRAHLHEEMPMKILMILWALLSCEAFALDSTNPSPEAVFSCIPNCTAHGCFLRCEARRPTYGELMRFPGLPSFADEQACIKACTCENYPVGPRLPSGEVSCQEW